MIGFGVALSHGTAQASQVRIPQDLISIQSDIFPGETYALGIESDGNGEILGISYSDPFQADPKMRRRFFSAQSLKTPQVLIRAQSKYEVVKISMSGNLVSVLFKMDVREPAWSTKKLLLDCDEKKIHCSAFDPVQNRFVTKAFILGHRVRFFKVIQKTVGIESIQTF